MGLVAAIAPEFGAAALKVGLVVLVLLQVVPIMTWIERRGSAAIQLRLGPNRVGPFGLFQPLADGLKFMFKEDVVSPFAHRPVFILAPVVAMVSSFMAFAVIPFGGTFVWPFATPEGWQGFEIPLVIADSDIGLLILLAATSLGVYGIVMAGWASNNKYSQIGGLRSSSQMISYELALGLSVIAVIVLEGSLRPITIVEQQTGGVWYDFLYWNVFQNPLGAIVLLIAGFAETNRLPFDLPEAETELVAGYHTEYSSMKFSMFFMAEYVAMVTAAALLVTLYFGGYAVPGFVALEGNWLVAAQIGCFCFKVAFFQWLFVWVRWTVPRFRFDQLMRLGWKVLIPAAFVSVVWSALYVMLVLPMLASSGLS